VLRRIDALYELAVAAPLVIFALLTVVAAIAVIIASR
jgi:hypothetical protein